MKYELIGEVDADLMVWRRLVFCGLVSCLVWRVSPFRAEIAWLLPTLLLFSSVTAAMLLAQVAPRHSRYPWRAFLRWIY